MGDKSNFSKNLLIWISAPVYQMKEFQNEIYSIFFNIQICRPREQIKKISN